MLKILLLAGGTSAEREVSLRSGAAVQAALEASGHAVTMVDPANDMPDELFTAYDVIFPVLHGAGGEDGTLQARLEALGHQNIVGADAASSALCFDKWRYKALLDEHDILNARGAIVTAAELRDHPLAGQPFVLKPFDGGSSLDTFIVRNVAQADFTAMEAACDRNGRMLIEELIEGIEITVGVLGDASLPVIEIIPPADGEFDYENKYNGQTQELCPAVNVGEALQIEAQTLAAEIHELCNCRDLSRTDLIVTPDGKLYVLETNTLPGMTNQSLYPKAAAAAGIPMIELCDQLAQLAAARKTT